MAECPCSIAAGSGISVTHQNGKIIIAAAGGGTVTDSVLACLATAMDGNLTTAGGELAVRVSADPGNEVELTAAGLAATADASCPTIQACALAMAGPGLSNAGGELSVELAAAPNMIRYGSDGGLFADGSPRLSAWTAITAFSNGWTAPATTRRARWATRGKMAHWRGLVTAPASPAEGQAIFTVGALPTVDTRVIAFMQQASGFVVLGVSTAGAVTYVDGDVTGTFNLYLDGISYPIA